MVFVFVGLLVLAVSLDWAKKCKPVNYKYKYFGYEYKHGPLSNQTGVWTTGCKKGCFSVPEIDTDDIEEVGEKTDDDYHWEQKKCHECGDIKPNSEYAILYYVNAEQACNAQVTCQWKSGKCRSISCPTIVKKENCKKKSNVTVNGYSVFQWRNGKCKNGGDAFVDCEEGCDLKHPDSKRERTQCKYNCTHSNYDPPICPKKCPEQRYRYEWTKTERKIAHRVYGCLYARKNPVSVSSWSVWAFIVTLVILILFVMAVIGGVAFLALFGGDENTNKEAVFVSK